MSEQELAYRIRLARGHRSRKELAEMLGKSPKTIERWEKNLSRPSRGDLLLLAQVLGVNPEWLFTGKGPMYIQDPPEKHFVPVPLYTIREAGPYENREAIFHEARTAFLQLWPDLPLLDPVTATLSEEPLFFGLHLTNDIFRNDFSVGDVLLCRKFTDPPTFLVDGGLYLILYNHLLSTRRIYLDDTYRVTLASQTSSASVPVELDQIDVLARVCSVIRKT